MVTMLCILFMVLIGFANKYANVKTSPLITIQMVSMDSSPYRLSNGVAPLFELTNHHFILKC